MSYSNSPASGLAPSLVRLMQFAQRSGMGKKPKPAPNLPGEPPLAQQVAGANPLEVGPRLLPPTAQMEGTAPQINIGPTSGPPMMPPMMDGIGQALPPRLAQMAGVTQPTSPSQPPGNPRPEPLVLPERTYDMGQVVSPPTLAPSPTRDVAKESNRAMQAALIPAGLGLLLGGAPGAVAGASGAIAGSRARSDQEAAAANAEYGASRANDLQQYGLDRQAEGDKTSRAGMQMRADAMKDRAQVQASREEWEAWNSEQERLAKAINAQVGDASKVTNPLLSHRAKTAELMSTQPEEAQRRVAGDFNQIAASLGHPEMAFAIPEAGPVFAMQPKDVNREALAGLATARKGQVPTAIKESEARVKNLTDDNKRADKALELDTWYKKRQTEIGQGRLNLANEKKSLDGTVKGVKSWEDAQLKIADMMSKSAKLMEVKVDEIMGTTTPPSEAEDIAASLYQSAADSLAAKFGKTRRGGSWVDLNPSAAPPKTSTGQGDVRAADRVAPVALPAVNARLKRMASPEPRSTPAPKTTPSPRATPAPQRSTPAPKPSATPKPAFLTKDTKDMTPAETEAYRQYLRKRMGLK